jgi:hypothetical protein
VVDPAEMGPVDAESVSAADPLAATGVTTIVTRLLDDAKPLVALGTNTADTTCAPACVAGRVKVARPCDSSAWST